MPSPFRSEQSLRHILIVSDAWHPQINGVVRSLAETVTQLRQRGHTVTVIGPSRFCTIPCPSYPEIRLSVTPWRLAGMIESLAPDALHIATEGPLGLAARRFARRAGYAFTTAYHTRFPDYLQARLGVPRRLTYKWLRRFHNAGAATMVATDSLAAELANQGFTNLRLWSRGVDLAQFNPVWRGATFYPRPVFLYVGRLAIEKNLPAFLDLDLPGTKLVIGHGPQRVPLQSAYPAAQFLGAAEGDALARAFASADVFVFPSRTDTFGLVLLEALASGLPVAAYPVPGPLDVLAGDAAAPAGVLDEDLRRAALAALTLDRQACRRHAEQFSWAASTAQFYENLVPLRTGCTATRPHDNSVQAGPAQAGTVSVDGSAASVRTACTASTTASNATESS